MIFLSDTIPNALITIKRGTGLRTCGTLTTNWRFVLLGCSLTILTAKVLIGLDASSLTDLISAL